MAPVITAPSRSIPPTVPEDASKSDRLVAPIAREHPLSRGSEQDDPCRSRVPIPPPPSRGAAYGHTGYREALGLRPLGNESLDRTRRDVALDDVASDLRRVAGGERHANLFHTVELQDEIAALKAEMLALAPRQQSMLRVVE